MEIIEEEDLAVVVVVVEVATEEVCDGPASVVSDFLY